MYLSWSEQTIADFSDTNLNAFYERGFVFTRLGKGKMQQTRSVRVDLSEFEPSSENRRVLRKTEDIELTISPLPYKNYHWEIGKMGKDFYETKFEKGVFSANKIKELLTSNKSNFNRVLVYSFNPLLPLGEEGLRGGEVNFNTTPTPPLQRGGDKEVGYCISLETDELLHYAYPFYLLKAKSPPTGKADYQLTANLGLGMMTKAVVWAKEQGKKYVYLGSAQRPTDTYKFQFRGVEWFEGKEWREDVKKLKQILNSKS